jgi:hypothetical protein
LIENEERNPQKHDAVDGAQGTGPLGQSEIPSVRRSDQQSATNGTANGRSDREDSPRSFLGRLTVSEWLTFLVGVGSLVVSFLTYKNATDTSDLKAAVGNLTSLATESRRQADAMQSQASQMTVTQRAFITASDFTITPTDRKTPDGSCWRIKPIITNDGGTPTRDMRYFTQIVVNTYPPAGEDGSAYGLIMSPTDPDILFKRYTGWNRALLGPKRTLIEAAGLSVACLDNESRGSLFATKRLYANGAIHYKDIFPDSIEHVTKFCFWIQSESRGTDFQPRVVLCNHWNCADE